MDPTLPNAKSSSARDSARERHRIRQIVAERGLCGLANDTKWNEFIAAMRERQGWRPRFRFKHIDGAVSRWDSEWFYHLPFPFLAIEWLELTFLQEILEQRLPPRNNFIDHSTWIEDLLKRIGLEHRKGDKVIRIFGYSPINLDGFEQ